MLEKKDIRKHLEALGKELENMGVKGEVCLYGGAVMCLAYDARPATKDVDAVFAPASQLREAVRRVAEDRGLSADWLNDAVKGFVVPHERRIFLDLPSLKVFVPEPDYLLAMKTLSARVDGMDRNDVKFLIAHLGLKSPEDVFTILKKYYPQDRVKPATQYFIEEIFSS